MRSRRLIIVLLLALASGLAAGWLALRYLRETDSGIVRQAPTTTTKVVVAAADLPVGHVLNVEDVKLLDWPGTTVPEGFATSEDEVLGRGLLQPVSLNGPLLPSKLAVEECGR
jgi:pilus assembly protein CpaB